MKNGKYNLVKVPKKYPGKKYRGLYAYEHIFVWWKYNKKMPKPGMEIHHINGEHRDNRIENLKLLTSKEHRAIHAKEQINKHRVMIDCKICGKQRLVKGNNYRWRSKHGYNFYCSKPCQHIGLRKQ